MSDTVESIDVGLLRPSLTVRALGELDIVPKDAVSVPCGTFGKPIDNETAVAVLNEFGADTSRASTLLRHSIFSKKSACPEIYSPALQSLGMDFRDHAWDETDRYLRDLQRQSLAATSSESVLPADMLASHVTAHNQQEFIQQPPPDTSSNALDFQQQPQLGLAQHDDPLDSQAFLSHHQSIPNNYVPSSVRVVDNFIANPFYQTLTNNFNQELAFQQPLSRSRLLPSSLPDLGEQHTSGSAEPTIDRRCDQCGCVLDSEASLNKHIQIRHTRPFHCIFRRYGCHHNFGTTNECKRHINVQHLHIDGWKCTLGDCPVSDKVFDRSDLFTQHLRRTHLDLYEGTDKPPRSGKPSAGVKQAEAPVLDLCHLTRPEPIPTTCAHCLADSPAFADWESKLQHVFKHMSEGSVAEYDMDADPGLREWLRANLCLEQNDDGLDRIRGCHDKKRPIARTPGGASGKHNSNKNKPASKRRAKKHALHGAEQPAVKHPRRNSLLAEWSSSTSPGTAETDFDPFDARVDP